MHLQNKLTTLIGIFRDLIPGFIACFCIFSIPVNALAISDLPIWSEVTPFESRTLHQIRSARRGSPDALLKIYLMASGDVRTESQYRTIKSKIQRFFDSLHPDTFSGKSEWDQGYLLNRLMHQQFFRENLALNESRYEADQSQLSKIFQSGRYNCISSSLLYIYLARKLDLDVDAVLLPTHSFVQLNLRNGKKIEIETTSAEGFDWNHDRKFYKKTAHNWFSKRGLRPSTYEDYLNRSIIKPARLAAVNMITQHTFPERMAFKDRLRLMEFSLLIAPEEQDNLLSLLYAYNNLYIELHQKEDIYALKHLYDKTYDHVSQLIKKYPSHQKISQAAQWYITQAAFSYLKVNEADKAKNIFLQGLRTARYQIQKDPNLNQNYLAIFNGLLKSLLKNSQTSIGNKLIRTVNQNINLGPRWKKIVAWYYSKRMQLYWQQQKWQQITVMYDSIKSLGLGGEELKTLESNVQSAFLNYSLVYEKQGNWRKAFKILLTCQHQLEKAQRCQSRLNTLKQAHQG